MSNIAVKNQMSAATIEQVLLGGDLSRLAPQEKVSYVNNVCGTLGLNMLTQPFAFIRLNGKEVLYAKRDATDQLRKVHGVSIQITSREQIGDVYVVTAKARDRAGREDESTGAVAIAGLKGDNLANAYLKAETKAKRRVTLSICGLGILDESEVDSVPRDIEPVDNPIAEVRKAEKAAAADPGQYVCTFGKFKNQKIAQIDMFELDDYVKYIMWEAENNGREIKGQVKEFIEAADAFLASREFVRER